MMTYNNELVPLRIKRRFVIIWPVMVGLMDGGLGLLWAVKSVAFMKVMGVVASPDSRVLLGGLGFIGVGVGLSYGLALYGANRKQATVVWIVTALLHGLAGVVLIWMIADDWLPTRWWGVALLGLLVAVVQMFTVRANWWSTVNKPRLVRRDRMPIESLQGIMTRARD